MKPEAQEIFQASRSFLEFQGELLWPGPMKETVFRPPMNTIKSTPENLESAKQGLMVQDVIDPQLPPAEKLHLLAKKANACECCKLYKGRTHVVFGQGKVPTRLMFVGEGPGREEDLSGEPFVGQAGHLLDRMIHAMTLKRSLVYIANIVKCRPPKNRDPEPDEVQACAPFLKEQIQAVNPEVIVALGRCAAQMMLNQLTPISKLRGHWHRQNGILIMPTFHPAYLLRNPSAKREVWIDLQEVMKQLGIPIPTGSKPSGNKPAPSSIRSL